MINPLPNLSKFHSTSNFFLVDCCQGTNAKFLVQALDYVEETLLCAEIVKLLPKSLAP
jgi:hypothetical protein